jgi:lysozyme
MKIFAIDKKGIELIKYFEGFKPKPYLCPANVPTIGYGTTRYQNGMKVSLNDAPINEAPATMYLTHDIEHFELKVDEFCADSLNQNQFNALVSFAYNLGENALKGSTLLRKVNANPSDLIIRSEFLKWVYAGKVKLPGLVKRRLAESDMYFNTELG